MSDDIEQAACWWVYIVRTERDKLYTGITTDVERRFAEHRSVADTAVAVAKGAKFFRSDPAKTVVYRQAWPDRSSASRREAQIKKMSRQEKLRLIESNG